MNLFQCNIFEETFLYIYSKLNGAFLLGIETVISKLNVRNSKMWCLKNICFNWMKICKEMSRNIKKAGSNILCFTGVQFIKYADYTKND